MTSSQKFAGFTIVPWHDSSEWKRVYTLIFDTNATRDDRLSALDIMNVWKTRQNLLPSGVEGTLWILEALLTDTALLTQRQICSVWATAIMRFLNICVGSHAKKHTFTKVVTSHGVPEYIVGIRHDFAHNQKLVQNSTLKMALDDCLEWLRRKYWLPEMSRIADHVIPVEDSVDGDVEHCFAVYADLIVFHAKGKSLNARIVDEVLSWGISTNGEFCGKKLLNEFWTLVEDKAGRATAKNWAKVAQYLVNNHCFFTKIDIGSETGKYQYELLERLIVLLYNKSALHYLIVELVTALKCDFEHLQKVNVAYWLNEIFLGLLKMKRNNFKVAKGKGVRFAAVRTHDIDAVIDEDEIVLSSANPYCKDYFKSYLLLATDLTEEECKEYMSDMKNGATNGSYTFPDLLQDRLADDALLVDTTANCTSDDRNFTNKIGSKRKRWVIDDDDDYQFCPIGILPYQLKAA